MTEADMPTDRVERDGLGERHLPAGALYGIHARRGAENFPLTGRTLGDVPEFLRCFVLIKQAAAEANRDLGLLPPDRARAIIAACREVAAGRHRDAFIVDLLEGSGGTSLNMNVNEVLANRALVLLGHRPGDYAALHPNDDVNRGQSTNDVVPTAIDLAAFVLAAPVVAGLDRLADALTDRAERFADVLRLGRTCLQDGQPMTLGQALGGYAALVRRLARALARLRPDLLVVPLGGTAIGTGLGAAPGFRERALAHLARLFGHPVRGSTDPFDGLQNLDGLARLSGELRTCAGALARIASDLILLASGPAGGLAEVVLPPVQAGSSIMPGKVNPVMPMMMVQIGFAVAGNDACIALAAREGQLEINPYEPVIAARLFDSLELLAHGIPLFIDRAVAGLEADRRRSLDHLLASGAIATALVPRLGYARTSALVREAQAEGRSFLDKTAAAGLLSRAEAIALIEAAAGRPAGPTADLGPDQNPDRKNTEETPPCRSSDTL